MSPRDLPIQWLPHSIKYSTDQNGKATFPRDFREQRLPNSNKYSGGQKEKIPICKSTKVKNCNSAAHDTLTGQIICAVILSLSLGYLVNRFRSLFSSG